MQLFALGFKMESFILDGIIPMFSWKD